MFPHIAIENQGTKQFFFECPTVNLQKYKNSQFCQLLHMSMNALLMFSYIPTMAEHINVDFPAACTNVSFIIEQVPTA